MKRYAVGTLVILVIIGLVGCGGSLGGLLHMTGNGDISNWDRRNVDGSYGDVKHFRSTQDGHIYLHMERRGSDPVRDPYIVVWRGSASDWTDYTLIDFDDDSGSGQDAYVRFYAQSNTNYSVLFTTYGPNDFGSYRYVVTEQGGYAYTAQAIEQDDKAVVDVARKVVE